MSKANRDRAPDANEIEIVIMLPHCKNVSHPRENSKLQEIVYFATRYICTFVYTYMRKRALHEDGQLAREGKDEREH